MVLVCDHRMVLLIVLGIRDDPRGGIASAAAPPDRASDLLGIGRVGLPAPAVAVAGDAQ